MAKKSSYSALPDAVPIGEKLRELAALAFVLSALFVLLSLLSYDPGDIREIRHPVNDPTANRAGYVGARVAYSLLSGFGLAAYLVAFLAGFWAFLIFFRRKLTGLAYKLVAAGVAVLAMATMLSIQPAFGTAAFGLEGTAPSLGGIYGQGIEMALRRDLGTAGTWLAVVLAFCVSIVLATDWMIYKGVAAAVEFAARGLIRAPARPERSHDRRKAADSMEPAVVANEEVDVESEARAPEGESGSATESETLATRTADTRVDSGQTELAPESTQSGGVEALPEPEPPSRPVSATSPRRREGRNPLKMAAEAHARTKVLPYEQPPIDLFEEPGPSPHSMSEKDIEERMTLIVNTLKEFEITARCVHYEVGPATTTFELELAPGTRCSAVAQREAELTMKLAAPVRVVAPIPNKTTVGVEVPNTVAEVVRMRPFLERGYRELRRIPLPIILGKTTSGEPIIRSLTGMPHLLTGGSTGSGKSVCLNTIITTLLVSMSWDEMKLILIDPKKVELALFADIPHLWAPVVDDAKKAEQVLEWLLKEMEDRYVQLKRVQARNIDAFNRLGADGVLERLLESGLDKEEAEAAPTFMPYIVVVIDEMANLMQMARKNVEQSISTLAAKARAVGLHLICATQRPSADVITGLIKANMPSRIGFRVASAMESRIILDAKGAERLLGKGDMLTLMAPDYRLQRGQCTFTSDEEIRGVVQFLKSRAKPVYHEELVQIDQATEAEGSVEDELFEDAVRIVIEEQRGSTSLLQRKLQVGYSRAARLIETMEQFGVVGPYNGSSAREVLLTWEQWEARKRKTETASARS